MVPHKTIFFGLRSFFGGLRVMILGLKVMIKGLRGVVWGLRGLIWGLEGLIWVFGGQIWGYWSSNLKYRLCPFACNWSNHVYGLLFIPNMWKIKKKWFKKASHRILLGAIWSRKISSFLAITFMRDYGKKKKTEQILREQKHIKMITNLHKISSGW